MKSKFSRPITAALIAAICMIGTAPAFASFSACEELRARDFKELKAERDKMTEEAAARADIAARLKVARTDSIVSYVIGVPLATIGTLLAALSIVAPPSSAGKMAANTKKLFSGSIITASSGALWIYLKRGHVEKLRKLLDEAEANARESEELFQEQRDFLVQRWTKFHCGEIPNL